MVAGDRILSIVDKVQNADNQKFKACPLPFVVSGPKKFDNFNYTSICAMNMNTGEVTAMTSYTTTYAISGIICYL